MSRTAFLWSKLLRGCFPEATIFSSQASIVIHPPHPHNAHFLPLLFSFISSNSFIANLLTVSLDFAWLLVRWTAIYKKKFLLFLDLHDIFLVLLVSLILLFTSSSPLKPYHQNQFDEIFNEHSIFDDCSYIHSVYPGNNHHYVPSLHTVSIY